MARVTMVKKRLASGQACGKCVEVEALLRRRGVWERVAEVVWAVEGDEASPGMILARQYGVDSAPFFVVEGDGAPEVVLSAIQVAKLLQSAGAAPREPTATWDLTAARAEVAGLAPPEIVAWTLARFGGGAAIAFSGAEDVVLIDMAARSGRPYRAFCLDTGRLHAETYAFLERVRERYDVALELMTPDPAKLEPFVREKGLFSFYRDGHGECCGVRKVAPLKRALATCDAWITGQRPDQSPATRGELARVEEDGIFAGRGDVLVKVNPLAGWTADDVWRYIRANDVPYNPLHERGFRSIGCEPCTRPVHPGQHEREGRWWWEEATKKECGLHLE